MTKPMVQESIDQARRLFRNGDVAGASGVLEAALEAEPDNPAAAHFQGVVKALSGDLPGALVHFVRALQHDPRNPEILHDLGNVWYEGKNFDEARRCFADAVALAPSQPQYLAGLARAELGLEHLDAAADLMRKAVALAPRDVEHVRFLAEILLIRGDSAEAATYWRQVVAMAPQDASARQYLETALLEAEGHQAEPVAEEAVPPTPEAPPAPTVPCPACGRGNASGNRKCAGCGMPLSTGFVGEPATGNLLLEGDGDVQLSSAMVTASVEDVIRTLARDLVEGTLAAEDFLLTIDRCEEAMATLYESSMEALLRHLRVTFLERGKALGRDAAWLAAMEGKITYAHEEAFRLFSEAWAWLRQYLETTEPGDVEESVRLAKEAMGWIGSLDAIGSQI